MDNSKNNVFHIFFNKYNMEEAVEAIETSIEKDTSTLVVPVNLDMMRISYKDQLFKEIINESEISLIDGRPIIWLSRLFRKGIKKKVSGSDLIFPVLEMCNKHKYSILIIGGKEETGIKACQYITNNYPEIKFAKSYSPEFGFEKSPELIQKTVDVINEINADIVLLCLSAPKQEKFYWLNKDKLNKACYICAGATVDFLAGDVKRAPKWMSKVGLEWFYRLCLEPKRLKQRYWLDFWFLIKIMFLWFFRKDLR